MKVTGESACVLGTPTYGIPYGGGAMSGCSSRVLPIHEMIDDDFGSTGAWLISRFHQLLVGSTCCAEKFSSKYTLVAASVGVTGTSGDGPPAPV
jgi:hypothetical protein